MITDNGRIHIKRFMSGMYPDISRSIALGAGSRAATTSDSYMQFEISRVDIEIVSYDFSTDRLVFRAALPNNFSGTIHEVGLFSKSASSAGQAGSRQIVSFQSNIESWFDGATPAVYTTDNTRVGDDSVLVNLPASSTKTLTYSDIAMDLTAYSSSDKILFAFNSSTSNVSSIVLRFMSDNENYYSFTVSTSNAQAGFNVVEFLKGSALVTGNPNWANITKVSVIASTSAAGGAVVNLDGIRAEDTDTIDEGYVLVARTVLDTPFVKTAGAVQDVEFPLEVTIG